MFINICYSPAGRSLSGKTVPEVLSAARGRRPRTVLKTDGTVFPNTDRPRLVNNIFFFSNFNKCVNLVFFPQKLNSNLVKNQSNYRIRYRALWEQNEQLFSKYDE